MHFLILFSTLVFTLCSQNAYSQDLGTYRGHNNIILLKDNQLNSDWLQGQLKRLKANPNALIERQLIVFLVTDSIIYNDLSTATTLDVSKIVSTYELSNFEGLVLLGKDGETKLKQEFIVNPQKIFDLIDLMPIRQTEFTDAKKID